jgi:hypothetical protein
MRPRIETRDVRNESLILMAERYECKPVVSDRGTAREMPVSHGDTKLQRHIEPSQIRIAFPSATRKIVNRVFGLDDGAQNASHARLRHGPGFQSAARHESTADRGKHNRVEEGAEFFVVRTIDEN